MLVKCGERVGTKILKVLNMRMCKINDEVRVLVKFLGRKMQVKVENAITRKS